MSNVAFKIYVLFFFLFSFKSQKCQFNSHLTAIDKVVSRKYNMLLTLSTDDKCNISCNILGDTGDSKVVKVEDYFYYGRFYYFFRFEELTQYKTHNYTCQYPLDSNNETNSNVYSITFPQNHDTKVLAYGDWSKCEDGRRSMKLLMELISKNKYDAMILLGDYAYDLANSKNKDLDLGNSFLEWVIPVTSLLPSMLAAGNHEYIDGSFEQFTNRFLLPQKNLYENLFYSFDINDVHFIAMNSDFPMVNFRGKEYLEYFQNWLKNDLKNTDKTWKVAYLHRPLYCSWISTGCDADAKILRNYFDKLLYEGNVDLVLAGHNHNYERMFPIYNNEVDFDSISIDENKYVNPKFPVHVICGSTGTKEGHHDYEPLEFSKIVSSKTGVCQLQFTQNRMRLEFISVDGDKVDDFEIVKTTNKRRRKLK